MAKDDRPPLDTLRFELVRMVYARLKDTIPEGASSDVQRLAAAFASLWELPTKW